MMTSCSASGLRWSCEAYFSLVPCQRPQKVGVPTFMRSEQRDAWSSAGPAVSSLSPGLSLRLGLTRSLDFSLDPEFQLQLEEAQCPLDQMLLILLSEFLWT